ncbi:hypothetical protein F5I97DRAFT_1964712 [Phlebopus sp. FC_14]|nr:hypothetical protein F5I97DRAFT_1964712 [Phlebopus sp. FC_14]
MLALNGGHLIIALTALFFIVASYAVLLSAFTPLSGIRFLDILAQDSHYKYLALLIIPTSSYFIIANWVSWQYFQNS